ncbi:unnamed protein product, partial [Choristocarpus tenellus]
MQERNGSSHRCELEQGLSPVLTGCNVAQGPARGRGPARGPGAGHYAGSGRRNRGRNVDNTGRTRTRRRVHKGLVHPEGHSVEGILNAMRGEVPSEDGTIVDGGDSEPGHDAANSGEGERVGMKGGTSAGMLARAEKSFLDMTVWRNEVLEQLADAEEENASLRMQLGKARVFANLYAAARKEHESLKASLAASSQICLQQQQLIEMLQSSSVSSLYHHPNLSALDVEQLLAGPGARPGGQGEGSSTGARPAVPKGVGTAPQAPGFRGTGIGTKRGEGLVRADQESPRGGHGRDDGEDRGRCRSWSWTRTDTGTGTVGRDHNNGATD